MSLTIAYRNLTKNASWLFVGQGLTAIIYFLQLIILTKYLAPKGYGALIFCLTFATLLGLLFSARTWETLLIEIPKNLQNNSRREISVLVTIVFVLEIALALLAIAFVFLTQEIIISIFNISPVEMKYILLISLALPFQALLEPLSAILRINNKFRAITSVKVFTAFIRCALIFLVISVGGMLYSVIIVFFVCVVIECFIMFLLAVKSSQFRLFCCVRYSEIKICLLKNLKSVLSLSVVATARSASSQGEILILGLFTDSEKIGLYALAKNVIDRVWMLSEPIYQAIFPEISKMFYSQKRLYVEQFARNVSRSLFYLGIIIIAVTLIAAPYAVKLLWQSYEPSITLMQILVLQMIAIASLWFPPYLLSRGLIKTYLFQHLAMVALQYLCFFVLFVLGVNILISMAIAVVFRQYFWSLSSLYIFKNISGQSATE